MTLEDLVAWHKAKLLKANKRRLVSRVRYRAKVRLTKMYPHAYRNLLQEELQRAEKEVANAKDTNREA